MSQLHVFWEYFWKNPDIRKIMDILWFNSQFEFYLRGKVSEVSNFE